MLTKSYIDTINPEKNILKKFNLQRRLVERRPRLEVERPPDAQLDPRHSPPHRGHRVRREAIPATLPANVEH